MGRLDVGSAPPDPEAVQAARRAEARKKMEEMLQDMRRRAQGLPEDKRKKYAADLKALENDQESISKVLSELGADLDSIPKDDRDAVKNQLRDEAWQPTKDAIGVMISLLCWTNHSLSLVHYNHLGSVIRTNTDTSQKR